MRSLLKFLLMAAVLILAGIWIMAIAKSCNKPIDSTIPKVDDLADKTGGMIAEGVETVSDGINDFASGEEDEFDDAEFDENGNELFYDDDEEAEEEAEMDDDSASSGSSGSSIAPNVRGNYLVVSGSFLGEENAKNEVKRLKKLGYDNAEVVAFDFSQYHSVCVMRTNSLSEARTIKNQLVNKHSITDAYVHKKRKGKRG